ncbi:hypothetical protein Plec18167_006694 [Paecilomyces lecythidis]|uniref:Uncharacterized protein n=1 Tax=Paecilomyces lecythidis TaxID=3004212 RepID=A0ABR3XA19_9EURO
MTEFNVFHRNYISPSERGRILPLVLLNVWYGRTLNLHIDVIPRPPGCQDFVVQNFREQDPTHPALIDWENTQIYQLALPPLNSTHHLVFRRPEPITSYPEVIQHPLSLNTSRGRSPSDPGLWQYREPDFEVPYTYQPRQFLQEVNESIESGGEKCLSRIFPHVRTYNFWAIDASPGFPDSGVETPDIEVSEASGLDKQSFTSSSIIRDETGQHCINEALKTVSPPSLPVPSPPLAKSLEGAPPPIHEKVDTVPLAGYGLTFFGYHEPISGVGGPQYYEPGPPLLAPGGAESFGGLWRPSTAPTSAAGQRLWQGFASLEQHSRTSSSDTLSNQS